MERIEAKLKQENKSISNKDKTYISHGLQLLTDSIKKGELTTPTRIQENINNDPSFQQLSESIKESIMIYFYNCLEAQMNNQL